jgi:hypothetical protein
MLAQRPWQRLSISLTTSRRTFTRSATYTALHLVFWTLLPPLPTLRCTTSPLDFESQPLSSSPDLLGNFLAQGDRKLSKTRSTDAILHNLHAPFRHLLFSLTLCRQFALHCLVLSLPVRSLLLECGLPCPCLFRRVRPSKQIPRSLTRSAVENSNTLTLFGLCRHDMSASNATDTTNPPFNSLARSTRSSRTIIDGVSVPLQGAPLLPGQTSPVNYMLAQRALPAKRESMDEG